MTAIPLELVQKCGRASGVRTGCSNTAADPRRTAPTAITAAIHRILIAHVRHRFAPFRCRSQTQPRSEAVAGRSYRIESVRRAIGLRGLPPSAPTSNPTGFRLGAPTAGTGSSPGSFCCAKAAVVPVGSRYIAKLVPVPYQYYEGFWVARLRTRRHHFGL